jgi:hypothetical protein
MFVGIFTILPSHQIIYNVQNAIVPPLSSYTESPTKPLARGCGSLLRPLPHLLLLRRWDEEELEGTRTSTTEEACLTAKTVWGYAMWLGRGNGAWSW